MCLSPRQVARCNPLGRWSIVTVPCGHCWECLRHRQNEMAALVVREAEYRGALAHVTLTYAPEHLPMYYVHRYYDAETLQYLGVSKPCRISRSTELFTETYASLLLGRSDRKFLRDSRVPRRKKLRSQVLSLYHLTETEQDRADSVKGCRSTLRLREDLMRQDYVQHFGRRECRRGLLVDSRMSDDGRLIVDTEVRPSLCRKDVSLYLKRERIRYERTYGCKLPKFTYNVIGEMGPKHGRPHFHLCLTAAPKDIDLVADWLFTSSSSSENYLNSWHYLIGDCKCKRVSRYQKGKPGKDGFEAAGKYIGKYMVKGDRYEEENVLRGFVEKPRRCCSANFGAGNLEALRSHLLCYDLFGCYNVNDPATYPKDKESLVSWVIVRNHLTINGSPYPVPRRIKQLIYYKDVLKFYHPAKEVKCSSLCTSFAPDDYFTWSAYKDRNRVKYQVVKQASVLSKMVSNRLQEDASADYFRKLSAFVGKPLQETTHSDRVSFENSLALAALQRSAALSEAQHKFLQKSVF